MKIHFRLSDERLITPTGISLVGQLLATSNFIRIINRLPMEKKRSQPQIPTGDILLCYIALLCQAKTGFDSYRELEADREFYKLSLGLRKGIPSPETARQRMDYLAENASIRTSVLDACVTMFGEMGIQPSPEEHGFVPIDAMFPVWITPTRIRSLFHAPTQVMTDTLPCLRISGLKAFS